jgi:hypothetical protein
MSSIRNPYNNVGFVLPPQPFGSVVGKVLNNENILIETAGLDPYNFADFGQELKAFNDIQKVHQRTFPPNRTNEFNIDTSNKLPSLTPLFSQGDAQNFRSLNNPPAHNLNPDLASQNTYIKPAQNAIEGFTSVLPIELNNSRLSLGPIFMK